MTTPTSVSYTGNGSSTDYTFPFPYLSKTHIKVYLNGVVQSSGYSFLTASSIRFTSAPTAGVAIVITRETPSTPIVTWQDGAVILAADQNSAFRQSLYIAEESRSQVEADAVQVAADRVAVAADKAAADASAAAAAASASSAAASVVAAATAYDNFDDRMLGNKTADPTVDNDGNALVVGALYFNSVIGKMKIWTGSGWQLAFNDTATASAITNDSAVSGATVAAALNTLNSGKANSTHTHAQSDITGLVAALAAKADASALSSKQDTLVSGTNIKTVGGTSLLGSGDVALPSVPAGVVEWVAMNNAPTGYLKCNGAAVSRSTYAALFAALIRSATVTITIASPGVITWNSHLLSANDPVRFTTTGALPTGLVANTTYFVSATGLTANSFSVSATAGGTRINTSGTQSGVHTAIHAPHGVGDGSTTFNVPDLRGEFIRGWDDGRAVDSNRAFGSAQAQDIQAHSHALTGGDTSTNVGNNVLTGNPTGGSPTTQSAGGTETRPRNVALMAVIKF